jgi:two-component system cell cycle response regulator
VRVLVADDDPVCLTLLVRLLKSWGYTTIAFSDGESALRELLVPGAPDLAILDWVMPGRDGIDIARVVRAQHKDSYRYIILISAKDTQADYLEALAAGADDLLTKPFDPQELKARMHVGQRILTLQAGLLHAIETTRFQATHDLLTGLPNRLSILDTLDRELARAQREHSQLAVIMGDVDHFKQVNDTHGHLIGDDVLREVASRMQQSLRTYDHVGRFGGEEFLILAPTAGLEAAREIGERVRLAIARTPITTEGIAINVTLSLGVTATPGSSGELLRRADVALYRAKHEGRNRTCVEVSPLVQTHESLRSPLEERDPVAARRRVV